MFQLLFAGKMVIALRYREFHWASKFHHSDGFDRTGEIRTEISA
jgi:hypothetical protein